MADDPNTPNPDAPQDSTPATTPPAPEKPADSAAPSKPAKPEKAEKPAKAPKAATGEKTEKADKADKPAKTEKADKADKAEKGAKAGKAEKGGKAGKADKDAKESDEAKPAGPPQVSAPTAAELLDEGNLPKKIIKAKGSKNITSGIAHILATFNNTQVCISDMQGNILGWSSAGKVGFKGSRKSTAYAAQQVAQDAARQAMAHGMREVEVHVKGPGAGRESAIRAIQAIGIEISLIRDVTPVPHNGCRPRKKRRV